MLLTAMFILHASPVSAYEYVSDSGDYTLKLTGYGTAGVMNPDFETPVFIGDWRVRGDFSYAVSELNKMGLVYSIDQIAIDQNRAARDAFAYFENSRHGRVEIGLTDSAVKKFGLVLPDVGGLRVNDKPIFYKKIPPAGPVISDATLNSGRYAPRVNFATIPTNTLQYAFSVSGLGESYNYGIDAGIRYRQPEGKTKTSFSIGASFIDSPDGYSADMYAPSVTADWRAQMAAGFNLQYNSWIWGLSTRVIYDQNPIGVASDGFFAGTGISYDLLKYSMSLSYLFSDTGIWEHDMPDYMAHSAILSFRYKYSEYVDLWISGGITTDTPFISAALRLTF